MGCDIHTNLEMYDEKTGQWLNIERGIMSHRNYYFFASLAGVRGKGPEPKDLPDNVSRLTEILHTKWSADAHSASWDTPNDFVKKYKETHFDLDEIARIRILPQHKLSKEEQELLNKFYYPLDYTTSWFDFSEKINMDKYRVVYWFDN